MTIEEMHYEFNLINDTIGGEGRRSFSKAEIDWLLNKAQRSIINSYFDMFEKTLKITSELSTLHIKWPTQPFISFQSHGTIITNNNKTVYVYTSDLKQLNNNYLFITKLIATSISNNCETRVIGTYKENDDLEDALMNDFDLNKSTFIFNIGKSTTDSSTRAKDKCLYLYSMNPLKANSISVEYVKNPSEMSIGGYTYIDNTTRARKDCELPESLHSKLIDVAVMLSNNILSGVNYNLKKDIVSSL